MPHLEAYLLMKCSVRAVIRRGLPPTTVLAFLLFLPAVALAAAETFPRWQETPFLGYVLKVSLALFLLWGGSLLLVRWGPFPRGKGVLSREGAGISLLSSSVLDRGRVYVFSCGPDVMALWVARRQTVLLGRWSREEWTAWHAEEFSSSSSSE